MGLQPGLQGMQRKTTSTVAERAVPRSSLVTRASLSLTMAVLQKSGTGQHGVATGHIVRVHKAELTFLLLKIHRAKERGRRGGDGGSRNSPSPLTAHIKIKGTSRASGRTKQWGVRRGTAVTARTST